MTCSLSLDQTDPGLLIFTECIVAEGSHLDIPERKAATVVGGPRHLHFVVNVEPFRVVISLLAAHGDSAHPTPRIHKVFKDESLVDGIATIDHLPPGIQQGLQLGLTFSIRQLDSHFPLRSVGGQRNKEIPGRPAKHWKTPSGG